MPRCARVTKGVFCTYHIVVRGNELRDIFLEDADREKFLSSLEQCRKKYGFTVYAYCLMNSYFHLLLNTGESNLSQLMKSLNVSHVTYFNRKYRRSGHLFQDRFLSEVVDSDKYLLQISKYIHRLPVTEKLVKKPADYVWSSYGYYEYPWAGDGERDGLVDRDLLLGYFSYEEEEGVREYRHYVEDGNIEEEPERPILSGIPIRILQAVSPREMQSQAIAAVEQVAARHKREVLELLSRPCPCRKARDEAMREVRDKTGMTMKEIGQLFGGLTEAAVSRIVKG